jgi:hypothetical protein
LDGFDGRSIQMLGGCCGARNNTIEHINILKNQFSTQIPDVSYDVTGILIRSADARPDHPTSENLISDIVIQENMFFMGKRDDLPDTHYTAAAVSVNGAGGASGAISNQVRDMWISLNQIDSLVPGIHMIGAWEGSSQNTISTAQIYCNTLTRVPIYIPNVEASAVNNEVNYQIIP